MATVMRYDSLYDGYFEIVRFIDRHGRRRRPRGLETFELTDVLIQLEDPALSLPVGCGRRLNAAIGVAEALQLISGDSTPDLLCEIAPNMRQFMTEDERGLLKQHGAYGPRAAWQAPHVLRKLEEDPDTRQAIITVYESNRDLGVVTPDVPCTLGLRLGIEDERLVMTALMRSNDVWWGLAYDAFQFTQLQWSLATALGRPAGRYVHYAASLHLYRRDCEAASQVGPPVRGSRPCTGVGRLGMTWDEISLRAAALLYGIPLDNPTSTEDYFATVLAPFVGARQP